MLTLSNIAPLRTRKHSDDSSSREVPGGPEDLGALERFPDLGERTYQTLEQEIFTGRLVPGSELVIVELARRLGVSRSPVKHALARLCGEGLAVLMPGRGYFVSRVDEEQSMHLLDARLLVEVASAERGVQLVTETQLATIQTLIDKMERLVSPEGRYINFKEFMERDRAFHSLLVGTSENSYLVQFHRLLNFHVFQLRMHFAVQLGDKRAVPGLQEHKAIFDSFKARNVPEAIIAVRQHIRNSMASFGVESTTFIA
jgi:DNA-binding GntR family transcriptional regulator